MQYPAENFFHFSLHYIIRLKRKILTKKVEGNLEFSRKMIYYYNIMPGAAAHVSNLSPVGSEARSRKAYDVWLLSGVAYCITN